MKTVKLLVLAALLAIAAGTANSADRAIYPAATHRRILLDFGGNWCPDCQVLDIYFHDARNKPILDAGFVLVDINIGRMDANLDLAEKYGVPLRRGVPALAVLGEHGELLYSQKNGEFEDMRNLQSAALTEFLEKWRPAHAN